MSDRLAVFNAGRIEQVGAPAEVYERPATRFVAGFVGTSNLLTGDVARQVLGRRGTFTVRPEKIRLGEPDAPVGAGRDVGAGPIRERRLPRPGHALHRRARGGRRARRHPAEPGDDLDRGARPGRQGCPPGLEATARAPRRGWGRTWRRHGTRMRGGSLAHGAIVVGACRAAWPCAAAAAAVQRAAPRRQRGAEPAPSRPQACRPSRRRRGPGSVAAWPGYVEDGDDGPARRLGHAVRGRDRLQGHRQVFGTSDEAFSLFQTNPSSTTSSRRRATPACGWSPAASSSRSTSTSSRATRHLPGSQGQGLQHGRRRPLRRAARPRREPADVADRRGQARPDEAGPRCSTRRRRTPARSPSTTRRSTSPTRPSYLMATKPDLGITNPYALDDTQFQAAVDLLKQQKPMITPVLGRLHQADRCVPQRRHRRRHDLAGHHQPAPGRARPSPVEVIKPEGGRDRLVRHLDDQLEDQEPELRLQVRSTTSPRPRPTPDRGVVRRGAGQLEGVRRSTTQTRTTATSSTPTTTRSGRTSGTGQTPEAECVDGRTDMTCKDFDDWVKAWTEIKG